MDLGPDDDRIPHDRTVGDGHAARPRSYLARGIAAGVVTDTAFTVPLALTMPYVHPANVAAGISKLLLALNMVIGYVGGRVAARAGMAHDDGRAQWSMACAVSVVSLFVGEFIERVRPTLHLERVFGPEAPAPTGSLVEFIALFVGSAFLIRFGYAMGAWGQAKREGRVQDEDEAGLE